MVNLPLRRPTLKISRVDDPPAIYVDRSMCTVCDGHIIINGLQMFRKSQESFTKGVMAEKNQDISLKVLPVWAKF